LIFLIHAERTSPSRMVGNYAHLTNGEKWGHFAVHDANRNPTRQRGSLPAESQVLFADASDYEETRQPKDIGF
jgi:hypothetical protein